MAEKEVIHVPGLSEAEEKAMLREIYDDMGWETKAILSRMNEVENIYFDRIDFNGDAISLVGKGQMDLQRRLNLTFHTVVGRDEYRIPILHELLGEASKQVLQIHVEGTLDNPITRKEAFPGINQALQQLQGEVPPAIGRRP